MKYFNHQPEYRSGATSIYAVVIATLLFSVITVSFIRIIVNEANRTASDELSQMAYDSALAGVEDAKAAVKKYLYCKSHSGSSGCNYAQNATFLQDAGCDAVYRILYNNGQDGREEVELSETGSTDGGSTNQAYACVKLSSEAVDYRSTLSAENPIRMVPLRVPEGRDAGDVAALQISWHTKDNGDTNYRNQNSFMPAPLNSSGSYAAPATLSATIIQTGGANFKIEDFDIVEGGKTDRAMAFLVPASAGYAGAKDTIDSGILANSNNHNDDARNNDINFLTPSERLPANEPQKIKCGNLEAGAEYDCSVKLQLPNPLNGGRNRDTFYLVLSLPYNNPETEFSVAMLDSSGNIIDFSGAQYIVDSTGRASDMYSRVEARLEFADASYPFPEYAVRTGGNIKKDFYVTADCTKTTSSGREADPWTTQACADSNDNTSD